MIRTTLIPKNTEVHFTIPEEYVGKEIEITCFARDEMDTDKSSKKTIGSDEWQLSDEQIAILNEELIEYEANPEKGSSWADVKKRLTSK